MAAEFADVGRVKVCASGSSAGGMELRFSFLRVVVPPHDTVAFDLLDEPKAQLDSMWRRGRGHDRRRTRHQPSSPFGRRYGVEQREAVARLIARGLAVEHTFQISCPIRSGVSRSLTEFASAVF